MNRVLITGGSGLIGRSLTKLLHEKGYEVAWLSRSAKPVPGVTVFQWDIEKGFVDDAAMAFADVLIHLAGENISEKRWTAKRKNEIIDSRVRSTELLIEKLNSVPNSIKTIIASSAIGFYRNDSGQIIDENSVHGEGFLSESVVAWENATAKFEMPGIRLVRLRTGIVLAKEKSAFTELLKTKKFGILPVLGNGKQIYSWIHINDMCRIYEYAIENNIAGTYNAVAPKPVAQKEIMRSVKKVSGRFYIIFPVPVFILKIMLGEMRIAVLGSQQISCKKIMNAGFEFRFNLIEDCVRDLLV